jgi:hypothetical protein
MKVWYDFKKLTKTGPLSIEGALSLQIENSSSSDLTITVNKFKKLAKGEALELAPNNGTIQQKFEIEMPSGAEAVIIIERPVQ